MPRWLRRTLIALAVIACALLIVPLIWPVPPLEDTRDPQELAFPDSAFVEVDGVTLHYREAGSRLAPTTIVLLHGFGASTFSWRDQLPLLADRARVIAFDRPAFGLTERPLPGDWARGAPSPYSLEANADQVVGLMDALGIEKAVLIGHSAGGAVAVMTAAAHPERVDGLVLEAPAVFEARRTPGLLSALLQTPQARRIGPLFVRRIAGPGSDSLVKGAYYRSEQVTAGVLAGYRAPLKARDWDRGLWELIAAPRQTAPADSLDAVSAPTIVVAGDRDTFVTPANSRRVYEELLANWRRRTREETDVAEPRFVLMRDVGHLPHEEQPERFVTEVFRFLDTLPSAGCDT